LSQFTDIHAFTISARAPTTDLELHQRLHGPDQRISGLEFGNFGAPEGGFEAAHCKFINDFVADEAPESLIEVRRA
jgi:hypothetical protein